MAALFSYLQRTEELINDIKQQMLNPAILKTFVNTARRQIAGQGECIRYLGSLTLTIDQRNYNFSAVSLGTSATNGISAALNVRAIRYAVGDGYQWIRPRSWPWFDFYKMNNPVPGSGAPEAWAQYAQGSTGSFYIDPIPDLSYVLTLDCTCYPIDLVVDATVEAIPVLWTDAIPYFAAYLAYLYVQRADAAKNMLSLYEMFMQRARASANPSINTYLYEQSEDPAQINKLGVQRAAQ